MKSLKKLFKFPKKKHSKSEEGETGRVGVGISIDLTHGPPTLASSLLVAQLPPQVIERILVYVCPLTTDTTYDSCEDSTYDHGCMLCTLRDLSHCGQTCKAWRKVALNLMYNSIRIDVVHYCPLEGVLAEKRKGKAFVRNKEPEDTAVARVRLLCRTLRRDVDLGAKVQYLKISYMAREISLIDIALIVAVTPNLKYVDLPKSCYRQNAAHNVLKAQLQGGCPDLRKMKYLQGGEKGLADLSVRAVWPKLEVLVLTGLAINPIDLRKTLAALPNLRALKVKEMKLFTDEVFANNDELPPLPPLSELVFYSVPFLTSSGLVSYLRNPSAQAALGTLSLTDTGIKTETLQDILAVAAALHTLSLCYSVIKPIPGSIPLLSSKSLTTMYFELTTDLILPYPRTLTYHEYLQKSIRAHGLPNLRTLYVMDPNFADNLFSQHHGGEMSSSNQAGGPSHLSSTSLSKSTSHPQFGSNNPFVQSMQSQSSPRFSELEIYVKEENASEWGAMIRQHETEPEPKSSRPVSGYGLNDNVAKRWTVGPGIRKSVFIDNSTGESLSVPDHDDAEIRPSTAGAAQASKASGFMPVAYDY